MIKGYSQGRTEGKEASKRIDARIAELGDWRGQTLARVRGLIKEADPDALEEVKWMGTPVWSHGGGITTGETYKEVVKLTFFKGAALKDPAKLFNSSLDGGTRRAIDIRQGERIDEKAFKALVRAAVELNTSVATKPAAAKLATRRLTTKRPKPKRPQPKKRAGKKPATARTKARQK
jgi:hypothetical protein